MDSNVNLISIIVPVYNTEEYLKECIDSILAQTYKCWELLLVDDGSTDASGAICDSYAMQESRIKVMHLNNGGQGRARNRALDIMKGEYVCFVDSDDYLPVNALDIMLKKLQELQVSLIQFASEKISGDTRSFNFSHRDLVEIDAETAIANYITGDKEIIQHAPWAKLYRGELFKGVRFPESKIYEDSATIYKLIEKCEKVAYVPEIVYYVRERMGSTTRKKVGRRNLDRLSVYEDMEQYFIAQSPNHKLRRCAVAAQVDVVWNLAAQVYKNLPKGKDRADLIFELKDKGKQLRKKGIYRDKKAKLLLILFLNFPHLFKIFVKFFL